MSTPSAEALAIEGVKSASFRQVAVVYMWKGVLYDEVTGIEYDVRQTEGGWLVNDDAGRTFPGLTIAQAVEAARRDNR